MSNQSQLSLVQLGKALNRDSGQLSKYDLPFTIKGKRRVYDLEACRNWLQHNVKSRKHERNVVRGEVVAQSESVEVPDYEQPHRLFWESFSFGSARLSHIEALGSTVVKRGQNYSIDCTIHTESDLHPNQVEELAASAVGALWVLLNNGYKIDRFSIGIEGFKAAIPINDDGNLLVNGKEESMGFIVPFRSSP